MATFHSCTGDLTPELMAVSGAILLSALVAAERITESESFRNSTSFGTAGLACSPNWRSARMASVRILAECCEALGLSRTSTNNAITWSAGWWIWPSVC
jgi:hypothetical protein